MACQRVRRAIGGVIAGASTHRRRDAGVDDGRGPPRHHQRRLLAAERPGQTDQMDADLVVIGAGALGLSTALHAALAGRSVVIIDGSTAGSQASGRAAGLFKSIQADELRTELARRSIRKAISFGDWAGVDLPVTRSGSLLIARTSQHREYLRKEASQSRSWGVEVTEIAPDQASFYQPTGSELALWCPEDIYIEEPMDLVRAYLAAGRLHGVELLESEPVTGITLASGRVAGVQTGQRTVRTSAVVDAGGAGALDNCASRRVGHVLRMVRGALPSALRPDL